MTTRFASPDLFGQPIREVVDHINRHVPGAPEGWQLRRVLPRGYWLTGRDDMEVAHGHLLLNGPNGSGKSLLLVGAIPFALDMDKREYRLTTFKAGHEKGQVSRGSIAQYVVLGSDADDKRPGYRYDSRIVYYALEWEWNGKDAPPGLKDSWDQGHPIRHLTTGVGLYASRDSDVESWAFIITDGRRLGDGGFDVIDPHTAEGLSQKRLAALLGTGGKVYTRNRDYKEAVNQYLFGFPTLDAFEQLLDVLLRVRQSKLGSDDRPSTVATELSAALPPLDEPTMEKLAKIISDVDDAEELLKTTREAEKDAAELQAAAAAYYAAHLTRQAKEYQNARATWQKKDAALADLTAKITNMARQQQELRDGQQRAQQEQDTLQTKLEVFEREHQDALKPEDRLKPLRDGVAVAETRLKKAQDAAAHVANRAVETAKSIDVFEKAFRSALNKTNDQLNLLAAHGQRARWEAVSRIAESLPAVLTAARIDNPPPPLDGLDDLDALTPVRLQALAAALGQADVVNRVKRNVDRFATEEANLAQQFREVSDDVEKDRRKLDNLREEADAFLQAWQDPLQEVVPNPALFEARRNLQAVVHPWDPEALLEPLRQPLVARRDALQAEASRLNVQLHQARDQRDGLLRERDTKLRQPEAAPVRSPHAEQARVALANAGIVARPFYETCDFKPNVAPAQQATIEAFLERAGLLDALVVPASDRGRALHLLATDGLGDALLTPDRAPFEQGEPLAKYIAPDAEALPDVSLLLQHLNWAPVWQHGALQGVSVPAAEASYIGAANRRRRREAEIQALTRQIEELEHRLADLERHQAGIANLDGTLKQAQEKLNKHRAWRELTSTAALLHEAETRLQTVKTKFEQASAKHRAEKEKLQEEQAKLLQAITSVPELPMDERLDVKGLEDIVRATEGVQRAVATIHDHWENVEQTVANWRLERKKQDIIQEETRAAAKEVADAQKAVDSAVKVLNDVRKELEQPEYKDALERHRAWVNRLKELDQQLRQMDRDLATLGTRLADNQDRKPSVAKDAQDAAEVAKASQAALRLAALAYPFEALTEADLESDDFAVWDALVSVWLASPEGSRERETITLYNALAEQLVAWDSNHGTVCRHRTVTASSPVAVQFVTEGQTLPVSELTAYFMRRVQEQEDRLNHEHKAALTDFVRMTLAHKVSAQVTKAQEWVDAMSATLKEHSFGNMRFKLLWEPKTDVRDTHLASVLPLMHKHDDLLTDEDSARLLEAFDRELDRIRLQVKETNADFQTVMANALDYRSWFEFKILRSVQDQATLEWEPWRELTYGVFAHDSGGEKALDLTVPWAAALLALYQSAAPGAPKLFALDEAFAGVDQANTAKAFAMLQDMGFNWIMTSEDKLAVSSTIRAASTYQIEAPKGSTTFLMAPLIWDGFTERRADDFAVSDAEVAASDEEGTA